MAQMTLEDFQIALRPKVAGTQNLVNALQGQTLDFFVMFSSDASIIGNLSQANYAAGNAFMDALANSSGAKDSTPFIALNLGGVMDAGAISTSDRLKRILVRQGYHLIKEKELLAMIEYSLGEEARTTGCRQFIIGFDYRSICDSDNSYSLKNPMFSHLLRSKDSHETKAQDGTVIQSIEDSIAAADKIEQVGTIVAEAIARKISTLVAVAYEEVDLQRSVVEFGLDSLVLIELKNWISQKFQATLQASEISDAKHIIALAVTVAAQSALVAKSLSSGEPKEEANGVKNGVTSNSVEAPAAPVQQKQPLPSLDDTLNQYLEVVRPLFTDKEYAVLRTEVEGFRKPGSAGHLLHARLEKLANDPQVDNWQADLYARNTFLRDRTPLIPRWNYFLSHLLSPFPHSAAQRAAIVSVAALQFKLKLEAGGFNSEDFSWFFNATREPRRVEDKMVKYPSNDYVVAFRGGNPYKISLRNGSEPASYEALKATFQSILDGERKPKSWVGILAADDRDSWAEVSNCLLSAGIGFILTFVFIDSPNPWGCISGE